LASTAPPPEGILLFARFNEATHTFVGMFISHADGSGEVEVPLPFSEGDGALSRSGREIAVAIQHEDGRIGTAIIGLDGTVLRVLEIPDPTLNLPCGLWSFDNSGLVCGGWYGDDSTRTGIFTVRASDGRDLNVLTTPPVGFADLPGDWSAGGQVVFKRAAGGEEEDGPLMLVDGAGGEPRPLSTRHFGNAGRFSPDGASVLTSAGGRIVIVDLEGRVLHETYEMGAFLFDPVWSPDGARIAYARATDGPFADIFTSLPDGTDRQQVTNTPANEIAIEWGVGDL
jgi:hypothetical protein